MAGQSPCPVYAILGLCAGDCEFNHAFPVGCSQSRCSDYRADCRNFRKGYCTYGNTCVFKHHTYYDCNDEHQKLFRYYVNWKLSIGDIINHVFSIGVITEHEFANRLIGVRQHLIDSNKPKIEPVNVVSTDEDLVKEIKYLRFAIEGRDDDIKRLREENVMIARLMITPSTVDHTTQIDAYQAIVKSKEDEITELIHNAANSKMKEINARNESNSFRTTLIERDCQVATLLDELKKKETENARLRGELEEKQVRIDNIRDRFNKYQVKTETGLIAVVQKLRTVRKRTFEELRLPAEMTLTKRQKTKEGDE